MFINCPYCRTLVATDPINDLPPTHCPHCMSLLRRDETVEDDVSDSLSTDPDPLLEARNDASLPEESSLDLQIDSLMPADVIDGDHGAIAADGISADHGDGDQRDAVEMAVGASAVARPTAAAATMSPAARSFRHAPSFVRGASTPRTVARERWLWAAATALTLALILQLLLADRARLAGNPHWRPVLNALCSALFCELPPWHEPAAFTLLQRDVRQHPGIPGALRVSATFRNDARWPQPWPQLRLTLSDVNGRPAGERTFNAIDYLGGPPGQLELASGERATIAMDIREPAARIVAYDFSFR